MVSKRYIYKKVKRYGPYYYQSYRDNGVVKQRFLSEQEVENLKKEGVTPQNSLKFCLLFF